MLIGDDFLLGFAMKILNEKPTKDGGILHIGLCISGLTIAKATEKLRGIKNQNFNKAIVYLGSFDIINGRELIELMNDFENFVKVCKDMEINAVACTLAPLLSHETGNRKATLEGFNKFLKIQCGLSVIDINKVFCGNQNFYMGQRAVSGSRKHVSLWSTNGVQEFRKAVLKSVGLALVAESPVVL